MYFSGEEPPNRLDLEKMAHLALCLQPPTEGKKALRAKNKGFAVPASEEAAKE